MKQIVAGLLLLSAFSTVGAEDVILTISNEGDSQRQEVVEADLQAVYNHLNVAASEPFVIKNTFGQEVSYQKTHDGKLLLYVAVQPHSSAVYTLTNGNPSPMKSYVMGKMYPERADDITWENDRGIYRVYGPALQRSGERSFGTDVWVKNTPELVVEARYRDHLWGVGQRDSLKRIGKQQEANEIYMATSFHHDHGEGLDCYAVGASLGCGAPALMKDGQLLFPYCYKDYRILDNGPLRFTVELIYNTTEDGITEHRLVSLDRGSHFNRMIVWYDGISQPLAFASGVVLHGDQHLVLGKDYVQYADPTDNPQVHQSQIYVATLFPEGVDETIQLAGNPSHALGIVHQYTGQPYTYYFGSAWSSYDIRTQTQWQGCINEFMNNLNNPLKLQF